MNMTEILNPLTSWTMHTIHRYTTIRVVDADEGQHLFTFIIERSSQHTLLCRRSVCRPGETEPAIALEATRGVTFNPSKHPTFVFVCVFFVMVHP